jgi:hypothetical protein
MRVHTICKTHRTTALVGPGTPLEELECVTCIAITDGDLPGPIPTDPEELFRSRITNHYNGNCCCGTCDPDQCYRCGHFEGFCTCFHAELTSPNYCNRTAYAHTAEPPF